MYYHVDDQYILPFFLVHVLCNLLVFFIQDNIIGPENIIVHILCNLLLCFLGQYQGTAWGWFASYRYVVWTCTQTSHGYRNRQSVWTCTQTNHNYVSIESAKGIAYAKTLAAYLHESGIENLTIWYKIMSRFESYVQSTLFVKKYLLFIFSELIFQI